MLLSRCYSKALPDRLCIYHGEKLIATHTRSYDRHQDFEDPDHGKELLDQPLLRNKSHSRSHAECVWWGARHLLQQFQSTDYRGVLLIVRAKFQRGQQGWQYPAKVGTIRVANHRAAEHAVRVDREEIELLPLTDRGDK